MRRIQLSLTLLARRGLPLASLLLLPMSLAACGDSGDSAADTDDTGTDTDGTDTDGTDTDSTTDEDTGTTDATDGEDLVDFLVTVENVSTVHDFLQSGAFDTPADAAEPGPLLPGDAYEVELYGGPGDRLSFATMFVHSNDLFFAPDEQGIALFDDEGNPMSGDVTDQVHLWDAGTEVNQEPGNGPDQPPAQSGPDTGADDANESVRRAGDDFHNLPAVSDVVAVTLTPADGNMFTLRIENLSTSSTLQYEGGETAVPLAPGVFVVHGGDGPLFTENEADRGEGLEALAEDGDPSALATALAGRTGLTSPIAPGVWSVHDGSEVLFADGEADRGEGLEALAEDGDPSQLAASLDGADAVDEAGTFAVPDDAADPAPAGPGQSYSFEIAADSEDSLSLATMLVQSNDLFFSFGPGGLPLFDVDGEPLAGDVTSEVTLWDAGTEANEYPGAGPNQPPRQDGPDTGADGEGQVSTVDDDFVYPAVTDVLRITITPQ